MSTVAAKFDTSVLDLSLYLIVNFIYQESIFMNLLFYFICVISSEPFTLTGLNLGKNQ